MSARRHRRRRPRRPPPGPPPAPARPPGHGHRPRRRAPARLQPGPARLGPGRHAERGAPGAARAARRRCDRAPAYGPAASTAPGAPSTWTDGRELPYDVLVLATGARPRIPDVPGLVTARGRLAEGARTLRTAADSRPLPPGPVVVLGGGVLGVESALALRRAGKDVTLVQRSAPPDATPARRPRLPRAGAVGRSRGVTLDLGRQAVEYAPGKLVLDDGQVLAAGTLLLCTGTRPETALARAAALAVREGVVVDAHLRTDDPRIHAIGDCAEHTDVTGTTLIQAWDQAEALARILTGTGTAVRTGPRATCCARGYAAWTSSRSPRRRPSGTTDTAVVAADRGPRPLRPADAARRPYPHGRRRRPGRRRRRRQRPVRPVTRRCPPTGWRCCSAPTGPTRTRRHCRTTRWPATATTSPSAG